MYETTDHGDVIVFGLERSRNGRKDDVVYVHTGQVPQGARLCARAAGPGGGEQPCFSTPDQIDSVFRDALRRCSFEQDVRTVVNGPPLLLFWLGQVLTRICDYHHSPNIPVATVNVKNLMLSDRYYPGNSLETSVRWLYAVDKVLRHASSMQRATLFDFLGDQPVIRQGGGWRLWQALHRALSR